jgi:oxygen-dependent protoporphyrinogen oxidase
LRTVIIGGGITGLAAAYELSTRNIPFVLLESSARLGGLVRTENVDGCTVDAGADSMLATKPAAIKLCEELGLGPRLMSQTSPRSAFVYARGRLHSLPSPSIFGIPTTWRGLARYELLPMAARIQLAVKRGLARSQAAGGEESVASFFRRHFGPQTVALIAEPLLGGIHSGDVEQLSIDAVAPAFATRVRSGKLFAPPDAPSPAGDGMFKALRGGMGELVAAIERRLPEGSIRLNANVRSLARSGPNWRVACGAETFDCAAVVLACPAYAAVQVVEATDPVLSRLCAEVPYASTVSVALVWPRQLVTHPLQGSGFVVARRHSNLRITACTWVSSKWEDRASPGKILLRAFLGGIPDPDAVTLSDDELVEIAVRDVAAVVGASGPPETARVYRWNRAGAQHNVGHLDRMRKMDAQLQAHPGLFIAGSGFRSIGVPDCVADGRAVGRRAAEFVGLRSNREVDE